MIMSQQHLSTHGNKKVKNLYCLPSKPFFYIVKKYPMSCLMTSYVSCLPNNNNHGYLIFPFYLFLSTFFFEKKKFNFIQLSTNSSSSHELAFTMLFNTTRWHNFNSAWQATIFSCQYIYLISKTKSFDLCCQILYEMIRKFVYTSDHSATSGREVSQ